MTKSIVIDLENYVFLTESYYIPSLSLVSCEKGICSVMKSEYFWVYKALQSLCHIPVFFCHILSQAVY